MVLDIFPMESLQVGVVQALCCGMVCFAMFRGAHLAVSRAASGGAGGDAVGGAGGAASGLNVHYVYQYVRAGRAPFSSEEPPLTGFTRIVNGAAMGWGGASPMLWYAVLR